MMPKAYVESTVVSNLTARPSKVFLHQLYQEATREWWMRAGAYYQLVVSPVVLMEIRRGDAEASSQRESAVQDLPILPVTEEAIRLAEELLARTAVPRTEYNDALHIATASINHCELLVSWNFKHIVNAQTLPIIRRVVTEAGYVCPEICDPLQLLGGEICSKD